MAASTGASAGAPGSGAASNAGMNVGGLAGEGAPGTGVIGAVLPPTFARPDAAHTAVAGAAGTRPWVPALRIKFKGPDRARNARMYEEMKAAVGNDPGFRFDDKTRQIETPYTYRMIGEQYPRTDNYVLRSHLDAAIADAAAPRKVHDHEAEAAALFGTARYRRRDRETVALLQRLSADQSFDYTDHDMAHMNERRTREMDVRLPERSGAQGARYLLHDMKYQGFTIGEGVKAADGKKYLVDNMGALKGEGVNTLYLGQLRHRDHQPMVDDWMRSPDREVSGPLRRYVDHSDSRAGLKSPNDLRGVLERAKAHGVRVVGIDDAAAVGQGTGDAAAMQRAALLNPYAEHRIRTDEGRGDGRYVVLVDQMHNNTHAGQPRGVAGLSQRLDIPAVKAAANGKLVRDVENKTLR